MRMEDRRKAVGGIKIETVFCFFFFLSLKIPASIGCRDFTCIMNRHSFQLAQPHPPGKSEGGFAAQPCELQNKKYNCCSIASQTAQGNSKCCVRNFGQHFSIKNWKWALGERGKKKNLIFALDFAKGKFLWDQYYLSWSEGNPDSFSVLYVVPWFLSSRKQPADLSCKTAFRDQKAVAGTWYTLSP